MVEYEKIKDWLNEAEMILIGTGRELSEDRIKKEEGKNAYDSINRLVKGRNFFILTSNTDGFLEQSGIFSMLTAAPLKEGREKQWERYTNWISCTLNHKLVIVELGEGFSKPQLMRWPFERIVSMNQKARLIRVGENFSQIPRELGERALSVPVNSLEFLNSLSECL